MSKQHKGKPNILLTAILLGVIVVPMGVSGTGVALPYIATDLGEQTTQLQWVVNGFNLTFAAFSLVAGSIADKLGHRRGLLLGYSIFGLSGVISALVPTLIFLDLARSLAGIGAALIFSCSGALLATNFSGKESKRAFALFGTAAGIGLGLGPTISAITISLAGWRGIFLLSAASILISIALTLIAQVPEAQMPMPGTINLPGALIFITTLTLIIAGISQSSTWGWTAPGTIVLLLSGITFLLAFLWEERRSRNPLLDIRSLASPKLIGLLLVPSAGAIGFVTLLTYYPTFLTGVWNLPPTTLGTVMLIMTVPVILGPLLAGKLHKIGVSTGTILGGSIILLALGSALLTQQGLTTNIPSLIPPFLITGLGFGLGVGLVDEQAIRLVPKEKSGMASGLVSTVRLGSEAICVAVFAGILTANVKENAIKLLPENIAKEEKERIAYSIASGETENIKVQGVEIELFHTILNQAMTPLLWGIAAISAAASIFIITLLRSNRR